jgi:phosphopantothenoylcysteine decarboxylase/phosphopantothenate--cysteine ligase
MNGKMWDHPASVRNLETLKADGVQFIDPVEGDLACGYRGTGRLAETQTILQAVAKLAL